MYYVTCDGYPLLDWRDNDLILVDPRVNLEVNTVGQGSFTIYKNHPHYDKLKKLKSVFEVSDETSVIFRGRATGDTVDFNHGKTVDLEGVMAFSNDSVVRPFSFPDDFQVSGDRVAFFLGWLIDNHNSQVQDFQKMKLGNVTVQDENFTRSTYKHASTWEILKDKLFDSSLGGYLCIRYEADGNYIDYLSEFTETNSQKIVFGENLLDLSRETEGSATYSAIIPLGAADITIEGQSDGNITDDLVKSGDTIYSIKAVEEYGWIFAPTSETTWEDIADDAELLTKGAEWLANDGAVVATAMEVTAADIHFTDEQIESLRIYKNVDVYSEVHGVTERFPLSKLALELLKPQNTKITVGKTFDTLTERTSIQQEEALERYSKITKTVDSIKSEVVDDLNGRFSEIEQTVDSIEMTVSSATSADGRTYATIKLTVGNNDYTGQILLDGNVNVSGQLSADALYAALGNIADLTVDKLSTSQRIKKYLAQDTTDDNYILSQEEELCFMSGVYAGGTAQATTPQGLPIYWESDPDEGTLGTDGFPYLNGVRIFTTTAETDWPVTVYTYTELTKCRLAFETYDDVYVPVLTMGAGDENGNNKLRMAKGVDGLEMLYTATSGKEIGITMSDEGYLDLTGQRAITAIAVTEDTDGNVTVTNTLEGDVTETIIITADDNGDPSSISYNGTEIPISWG